MSLNKRTSAELFGCYTPSGFYTLRTRFCHVVKGAAKFFALVRSELSKQNRLSVSLVLWSLACLFLSQSAVGNTHLGAVSGGDHKTLPVMPVHIAVASNFRNVLEALVDDFSSTLGEHQARGKVLISSASSGKLFAQISHGAPYDIFLSADQQKPAALIDAGLALADTRFTYAEGALVAWVARASDKSVEQRLKGAESFNRIAIANPKIAPYGKAAEETLRALNITPSKFGALVRGENIAQAYQFVQTKAVDIGFVAYSQILDSQQNSKLRLSTQPLPPLDYWLVPPNFHTAILQDAVLLKRGQGNEVARAFYRYLSSREAKTIIKRFGYRLSP